jgi:LCP family protein required for cell wall assembly
MTGVRRSHGRALAVAVLALALLILPGPAPHPTSLSLVRLESAGAVDLGDGVVWILAVGSDADPGEDLVSGRADAIQLVGLDVDARRAVAIGIPRDFYVEVPGPDDRDRINSGLERGGPEVMARLVEDLTGIEAQYVVTSGPELFAEMVDAVGGLTVRSRFAFVDSESGLRIRRGSNRLDGEQAAAFAGSRELPGDDFGRSANQQALLRAVLAKVRAQEDRPGFLETGALAAFRGLETDNLAPTEIYRFAHAIAEIDPRRVTTCVLGGTPFTTSAGAAVIIPDKGQVRRVARDARDARLDRGC